MTPTIEYRSWPRPRNDGDDSRQETGSEQQLAKETESTPLSSRKSWQKLGTDARWPIGWKAARAPFAGGGLRWKIPRCSVCPPALDAKDHGREPHHEAKIKRRAWAAGRKEQWRGWGQDRWATCTLPQPKYAKMDMQSVCLSAIPQPSIHRVPRIGWTRSFHVGGCTHSLSPFTSLPLCSDLEDKHNTAGHRRFSCIFLDITAFALPATKIAWDAPSAPDIQRATSRPAGCRRIRTTAKSACETRSPSCNSCSALQQVGS